MQRPRSFSPDSKARVQIKNRRKRYLDLHPDYFENPSLELADPLAYDRLIRRFQSASEREDEGRKKGYSGVLEADLWRSEAKVEALSHPDQGAKFRYLRDDKGHIQAEAKDEVPLTKEEGLQRWRQEMEFRFLRGDDGEFDYRRVDENDDFDDQKLLDLEKQDEWFDKEMPSSVDGQALGGETGVQDF